MRELRQKRDKAVRDVINSFDIEVKNEKTGKMEKKKSIIDSSQVIGAKTI